MDYFFGQEYANEKKRKIIRFRERIDKFKKDFGELNWKEILGGARVVVSEEDIKEEEKNAAIKLLEEKPFDYIKSFLSNFRNNSNKFKVDKRIAERLFNVIDCLLIQSKKN